jgi:hypothetical protein
VPAFAEIEINGSLMSRFLPTGTHYGHAGNFVSGACTVAGDVVQQIDRAQADGARRLLALVDCKGGESSSAYVVAERLRRFSRECGPVIAFVRQAWSSAPHVALAADYVVLAEGAPICIHGASAAPGTDLRPIHEKAAAWLAARTGVLTTERLRFMLDETAAAAKPGLPPPAVRFEGSKATSWGFADELGDLECARALAASSAPLPESERSRRMAHLVSLPEPAAESAIGSSDGPFTAIAPVSGTYPLHEHAASAWEHVTGLDSGLAAIASDGAGTIVAVGTDVCSVSTDDGLTWASQTIGTGVWRGVAWAAWLDLFVAVGDGTICKTSPDGVTWTTQTITTGDFKAITVTDTTLVAVGASCASTSTNGASWTDRSSAIPSGTYTAAATSIGGDLVVAVGTNLCATSTTDGSSWTSRTMATGTWAAVAYGLQGSGAGCFLAVGASGAVATAGYDGSTWTLQTPAPASPSLSAVAHDGLLFAIMSSSNEKLFTTRDGEVLTMRYGADSAPVALCWTGRRFVVVAADATGEISMPV